VGDKEQENNLVAVRARGGIDLGVMSIEAFEKKLFEDVHHQAQHSEDV
jgi:threonyl-tRNA synthetase